MTAILWLRVLLPLAVLSQCLSEEALSTGVKEEDPQGDDDVANTILKEPEPGQLKKTYPCYEDDYRFTPIISKDAWDDKKNTIHAISPVEYLVVRDGGKRCKTHAECLVSLSAELRKTENAECRTLDNFYVGGNGEVYEGRGWYMAPYWHLNGMRRKAVTVKFLGSHDSEGPTERALRAFWRMAKSGVWEKRLSADYRVVSLGQVYNDSTLVGDALEKVFRESNVGVNEFSLTATWETTPDESLPLITREEWGAKRPSKPLAEMGYGVKYVMVNEGGERCFTQEDCMSRIKAEQEEQLPLYGDLVDNFYIGDDGHVYEGRGFRAKPLWDLEVKREDNNYFKDESLTVRFLGSFQSDAPSDKAIGALKLLVRAGVSLNNIASDYEIYSLRGIYNDSRFLGDGLLQASTKWTPWAAELDDRIAKRAVEGDGLIWMVKRGDWGAKDPTKEFATIKHPVDYVIIGEHSESEICTNSKDCISLMKDLQEKDVAGYGDVRDNFYVSDNGNVYEGRGWDTEPQFQPNYFNKSLITVSFLGNHQTHGASLPALAAFDNLIRVGLKLGKIAPNYHFYSSRNIYDEVGLLGDGLKENFLKTDKWSKKLDTLNENERMDSGLLPIRPHTEWSEMSFDATYHTYTNPVRYVVIGKTGERCFTQEECAANIKVAQGTNSKIGFFDNFYIGDDGMAYEGRGWMNAPSIYSKHLESEFYYVTFLGKYSEESLPSKLSIYAFNRLMENGVKTQKLSPDFKIISIHQIFESDIASSDNLYKTIKTWGRWTSEFTLIPEATPAGHKVFVGRAEWQAEKPTKEIPKLEHPLTHVLVHNVGDHCSDMSSCVNSVQAIQKNTPPRYWDVTENFYVGDDGHIYEGRGWDHSSLWGTKGIENKFLSVAFLGSFESSPPSQKALLAFHVLFQTGIIMGKLTPAFKTVSLGEILKEEIVVSESLIGALNVTDNWSDDNDLKYDSARLRSLNSSFVLSNEWNLSEFPIRQSSQLSHPLNYIAIGDGGGSCDTYETCIMRITKEHKDRHDSLNSGVAENFYIGNDGNVYEGIGWDWDMTWGFNGWQQTISVQFFGNYENNLPSEKAIEAFNAVIIKGGIEARKLSENYKIVPIPDGEGRRIGSKLREEIMTWKNAVAEIE